MVSAGVPEQADHGGSDPLLLFLIDQARFLDPGLTRDALCGLMQQFIADVQSGVHQPKGWPNSCYGVSKCGLTALTMMLARQLQVLSRFTLLPHNRVQGWCKDIGSNTKSLLANH